MITDSRNKGGTLTLGAEPFSKQATSVTLTPSTDQDGDPIETLDGSTIAAEEVTNWTLDVGAVQDFDDAAGFVNYCMDNAGDEVAFSWKPNATGPTFSGTVKIRPVAIGGEVASRLTTSASFPVVGQPNRAPAA